jgi:ABC-type nitrate/sulfonate/bicarbonate transport system permease component
VTAVEVWNYIALGLTMGIVGGCLQSLQPTTKRILVGTALGFVAGYWLGHWIGAIPLSK